MHLHRGDNPDTHAHKKARTMKRNLQFSSV